MYHPQGYRGIAESGDTVLLEAGGLTEIEFYLKTRNRFLSHPLGDLGVMYTLHLYLVGKLIVDFLFAIIQVFNYLLRLRRYKRSGRYRRGGSL